MTTWNESYHCWSRLNPENHLIRIRLLRTALIGCLMLFTLTVYGQSVRTLQYQESEPKKTVSGIQLLKAGSFSGTIEPRTASFESLVYHEINQNEQTAFRVQQTYFHILTADIDEEGGLNLPDTVPNPPVVLRKSMMIPGWGQVVNKQAWKVPVIYGLLGGLTYYSILMDRNYKDYRAAFYNSQFPDGDERFGSTPDYINQNINPESLRFSRNMFRNRRDLLFIGIGVVYGLNIIDAYVFAHLRDFDVSDDLSARVQIGPPFVFNNEPIMTPDRLAGNELPFFRGTSVTITLNIH